MSNDEKRTKTIQQAMEQNAEFFGFDLCDEIEIGGGETVKIMYRDLLDIDTKARVDQVYRDYAACDRMSIEAVDGDGKKTTIEGGYKEPREKGGAPFDLDEQVSIALWGEDAYKRYTAAGGPPGLTLMVWTRMQRQINKRVVQDSKSS